MRPPSLAKSDSLVASRDVGLGFRPPAPLARRRGWRRALRARYDQRMTNPSTKTLLALLSFAMMTGAASAQQGDQPRDDDRHHDDDL